MEQQQMAATVLEKVRTYDFGQSRAALTELSDEIRKAHGKPEELKKLEASLAEVLKSDAKFAGKQYVCQELSIIGTDQSVPALAPMLIDREYSDMARFALERIPGEAADRALLEALSMGEPNAKTVVINGALGLKALDEDEQKAQRRATIGIVNSLGERGCKPAAAEIAKLVDNADKLLAGAAISALGKIGGPDALQGLDKAAQSTPADLKMLVYDAYLNAADKMVAAGDKAAAQKIWMSLARPDMPSLVRAAAMKSMAGAAQGGRK